MALYEDIKEKLNEYEAPPVYERGNAPFESKRVPEDRIREEGYLYFSTHGTGPGTKPKDVRVREMDWDLPSGWVAIKTDRPLTGEELDYYDIQPETKNNMYRKRFGLTESEDEEDEAELWVNGKIYWSGSADDIDVLLLMDVADQASEEDGKTYDYDEVDIVYNGDDGIPDVTPPWAR